MTSPYFHGSKPKGDAPKKKRVPLPPSLNPEGDTRFTKPPPARRVLVRTHTRAAPTRKAAPVETVRPASHLQDIPTPPVGSPPAARRHWEKVTGRKLPPEGKVRKPGPVGDEKSQLNASQLAKARRVGVRPTVAMKALEQTVHPLTDLSRQALGVKPFNVGGAVSDVANIGANFVPVGKAAGIFAGLRGIKGLKAAKVTRVVRDGEAAVPGLESLNRPGHLYRGMTEAEYQATVAKGAGAQSSRAFSHSSEGTSFSHDIRDAESYVNFGRDDPRKTGKPTYLVEVKHDPAIHTTNRQGYVEGKAPSHVTRVWEVKSQKDKLVARAVNKEAGAVREAVKAVGPVAEEAAAFRGAVSGKTARKAIKAGGKPAASAPAPADVEAEVQKILKDPASYATYGAAGAHGELNRDAARRISDLRSGVTGTPDAQSVARLSGKSVRQLQKEQKQLYSQERARRAAAAQAHLSNQALAPDERIRLAKHELKGELPKIKFQGFTELSDEAVTAMQKHILDHPTLMPYQKITASTAMTNALTGKLPTPSELKLLEHVFGKDTTAGLGSIAKHPLKDTILGVLNVPRSIMASFDLSAPFRQGLVVATRHPKIFVRNFKPMVKAFGSEKVYQAALDEIQARPTYPLMMEAKLSLTNLGHAIGEREEQFASNIAETLTGGKRSPIRASGRAYTGFLDKTRADVFDHLIRRAQTQGLNVHDPTFLKSLGTYINSATGRGDLGAFQEAGKVLNAVFFSPRLLASRLNFLNPLYYKRLDPFARKEALRSAVQLAGTLSTLLALASRVPGVNVVTDPRNPDWGKIKVGNTRIDIAGGFQQHLRLFAQLATGVAISSTTGKKLNLTAGQFGNPTRLDLLLRFFEGKEAPIASFATDFLRGSNQVGEKFDVRNEAVQRMLPLLAQDSYDLYRERHGGLNGLAAAFAGYAVGSVGLGMQTYGPRPTVSTKKPQSYFAPATSGGSSYFSPSSSGDSGYFGSP